ncbi:MAG: fibronectin type III domain-containing protein [Actinomycetota bacterium]|nr:fibronectin type III domain-containing protein [Actinomycetota bacterium]
MSLTLKSLIATLMAGLAIVGVAAAASTPAVTAESAGNVGNTTATLIATINPNGSATGYSFQYGPTIAYGFSTNSRRIGAGSRPVTVHIDIAGLTPGTPYHFHVAALNRAGTASGTDKTFTTTGPPPAAVVTGPAVNVGKTGATATGSINPQGAATTWAVQYGVSTSYGSQTIPAQPLAAVTTSLPVSVVLSGLTPGALFHYRLIAYHGGNIISVGADATFFTEPSTRPRPRLNVRSTPSRDRSKPYAFTTTGRLSGANSIPTTSKCSGTATLKYYIGSKQIGSVAAQVGPDCSFSGQNSFRRVHAATPARITIKVHFNGNGYVAPVDRSNTVTAG